MTHVKTETRRRPAAFALLTAAMLAMAAMTLAACEEEGPAERAGEAIDEAVKDAGRAVEDATD